MSKTLTLEDRYYLNMHSRKMNSTLMLRLNIDSFLNAIDITSEEAEKYAIGVDPETHKFVCNDPEYTVTYEDFNPHVIQSMKNYISMYDHEGNADNQFIQRAFTYFRKII